MVEDCGVPQSQSFVLPIRSEFNHERSKDATHTEYGKVNNRQFQANEIVGVDLVVCRTKAL